MKRALASAGTARHGTVAAANLTRPLRDISIQWLWHPTRQGAQIFNPQACWRSVLSDFRSGSNYRGYLPPRFRRVAVRDHGCGPVNRLTGHISPATRADG